MAKKKRRGQRPQGVDPNEARRQRLEARRLAKAQALEAQRRKQVRETWTRRAVIVALAAGLVWFLILRNVTPSEFGGHPVETFSIAGAGQHSNNDVAYETSPPVSGEHSPQPAGCGVYGAPIPDESMVHTLEHGGVGLLYAPDLEIEQIRELESIVTSYDSHVFSAPYEGAMETPIAITSWGHIMRLESVDEQPIRDFVDEFRAGGDAPEAFQDCPNEADEPFEPAEAEPSPGSSPTDAPTAAPTPKRTKSPKN